MNKNKKIILSGGGTGGSVTPLFQIYRDLKHKFDFIFVGTYSGLEVKMVKEEGIIYRPILSGKWRRYFSFENFIDFFKIILAFWQSLFLLIKERPHLVISAGGFVAVPLSWAAWILRIPVIIHQQDVVPGLANKIMSRVANIITVTFSTSLKSYGKKARLIGNLGPDFSKLNLSYNEVLDKYKIKDSSLPLLLFLGGGTGSLFLNKLIKDSLEDLLKFSRIIHVVGSSSRDIENNFNHDNYLKIEFVHHQDLLVLMSLSDLVVSRCGLATLTELSFLSKPSILIPMPDSHQEFNAFEFLNKEAAIVLSEKNIISDDFVKRIKEVLIDNNLKNKLSQNISQVIKNGNQEMIAIIDSIVK
jgi:UDP-N-acetylglucosamine--N-acetylmuramyl-(pentapeptide) pyrophosphoryl-undecaprenol N-acetylglucosamine transferase